MERDQRLGAAGDEGLRWSFDFDLEAALAEIGRPLDCGDAEDQEEILADEMAVLHGDISYGVSSDDDGRDAGARRGTVVDLSGVIAETLPAGPGLAAWLSQRRPAELADQDLPRVAAALRRVASWAQAEELAVVAQIAARSAARDDDIGVAADGRPLRVPAEASAQVSFGLVLSPCGAAGWTDLAVMLQWRLRQTGAALAAGHIDLYRARVIAEATTPLSDEDARSVEDKILPRAGDLTYGQLHAAVRRAVMTVDPRGAEERRQAAERRAAVSLYPDDDGTATLTGSRLPTIGAAAAMARLTAMARALMASGAGGGIDLLRTQVYLGLLLGTMPLIPPPPGAPPDDPPPDDPPPDDPPPDDPPPDADPFGAAPPGDSHPGDGSSGDSHPGGGPSDDGPPGDGPLGNDGDSLPRSDPPADGFPADDGSGGSGTDEPSGNSGPQSGRADPSGIAARPRRGPERNGLVRRRDTNDLDRSSRQGSGPPRGPTAAATGPPGPGRPDLMPWPDLWSEIPPPSDADAPEDDGFRDMPLSERYPGDVGAKDQYLSDDDANQDMVPAWPPIPQFLPAEAPGAAVDAASGRPLSGLLDLSLSWATLTGASPDPGLLGRIGPIAANQVRELALTAAHGRGAQWRVILTDSDGHFLAVSRVRLRDRPGRDDLPRQDGRSGGDDRLGLAGRPGGTGPPSGNGLPWRPDAVSVVGRVTVTVPATVASSGNCGATASNGAGILAAVLRAARRAKAQVDRAARVDAAAPGGCAHLLSSAAYRPPSRIREHVTARDRTCRHPYCGQPAWRGDLDHTRPFDRGGLTCWCNLGALCRTHHLLKHHPGWILTQPRPGTFTWTTPAGLTYTISPDTHP